MNQPWDAVAETAQFTVPLNLTAFRENVSRDARILEVGCGYGRVSAKLAANGFKHVRGYDVSSKMIERANAVHPDMRFAIADAAALPEKDQSFDVVVVSALLTCVPDPAKQREVINEIRRVLLPGGAVHGVEFLRQPGTAYKDGGRFQSRYGIPMWHFEPHELKDLFGFADWKSWQLKVPTLSGSPADILQFIAAGPESAALTRRMRAAFP